MASEAEIERLYQLFVTNGGGALSFSGTNLTPKQYSEALATSNLTPLEMAQLEARQRPVSYTTSDAADDLLCVDLGGRRIIKKKTSFISMQHTQLRSTHTRLLCI